ncbi:MAG: heavy-metal-associated domain-containing protein [Flavobacteriales bacterium]|nr:heavy-metal-associated domain-containing protein [Flavobacteriales bacterium]
MKYILILIMTGWMAIQAKAQQLGTKKIEEAKINTSAQCEMCKERIEKALYKVKGVISANLDLHTKAVTIIYKPHKTNIEALRKAINLAGYNADNSPANTDAYNKLPECCQKVGNEIHHK